jgi:putative endonuclease
LGAARTAPVLQSALARAARARALGERAEAAVVEYLTARDVAIVAQNLHVGRLEIDIVAREGPVVMVVEVRVRGANAWTRAFGSMDAKKRLKVRRAGERLWRDRFRNDATVERMRFDAASVTFDAEGRATVEYVKAAF